MRYAPSGTEASPSRLLCVAEAWGFGPAAKLFAVIRALSPRPRVMLACTGTTGTFGQLNADQLDEVIALDAPRDVLDVTVPFDAVLTVMDPWAALVGARRGVRTLYVDSLFWFWNWQNLDTNRAAAEAERWRVLGHDEVRREMEAALDWHEVVPMAYLWSSRVFVQRTPGAEDRLALYPPGLIEPVGAVVAAPRAGMQHGPPIISLSGAISHATPMPVALRYAEMVAAILDPLRGRLAEAIVAGHPAILPVFAQRGWSTRALSAEGMRDALSKARFALVPAGLTTTLEAAAAGTPLLFLPEQHGGHAPNRDIFAAADPGAYDDLLLRRWFATGSTDPAGAIAELDGCYARLLRPDGAGELTAIQAAAAAALDALLDSGERNRRAARQRRCALAVVGDFDGAATIAGAVMEPLAVPAAYAGS